MKMRMRCCFVCLSIFRVWHKRSKILRMRIVLLISFTIMPLIRIHPLAIATDGIAIGFGIEIMS